MKVRKKRKSTDAKQARLQLMSETVRQEVDHMTMFIHMLAQFQSERWYSDSYLLLRASVLRTQNTWLHLQL